MIKALLDQAGFSPEAGEIYSALLLHGSMTAGALLKHVSLKRGLLYKVLHDLIAQGYVIEGEIRGRMLFSPQDPDVILDRLEAEASEAAKRAGEIRDRLPELRAKYLTATERPTVKYFEGVEGLRKMYESKLKMVEKHLYFVRPGKVDVYQHHFGDWFADFLERQRKAGITVHGITADDPETNHDVKKDVYRNFLRTWIREEDYSAPVEWSVFDNTLSIISYGQEIFGIMIDNPQIAKAMKEIFELAKKGAETIAVPHNHA
ncbi:MAG: Transcriptional regulator, TrmB [Candidatus Uhrbacteria bacterium GW2011_GWD2_52_7]|uniref:Transcriptional regulator, TrmB n=1 Tax=Candidatus Uhrbacteria bacterium GW2011_GWD2_52_7 TaxID=1618989 RepID=A0A0G1XIG6_9BACT|nr:MAG: Transcriptional regulator, TrmB [Candidatus Uhrbacteria bacterium GW2011_GWD2_52_7]